MLYHALRKLTGPQITTASLSLLAFHLTAGCQHSTLEELVLVANTLAPLISRTQPPMAGGAILLRMSKRRLRDGRSFSYKKRHMAGKNPKSSGSKATASPPTTGNCMVVMRMVWFSEKEQPLGKRSSEWLVLRFIPRRGNGCARRWLRLQMGRGKGDRGATLRAGIKHPTPKANSCSPFPSQF